MADMKVSQLIAELQKQMKEHGDLQVLYVSGHDWAMPISCVEVTENPGWEDAPEEKALYLE